MSEFFHRKDIATRISGSLLSNKMSSGLFLSAPRRTGKSTFLHEDLIPSLFEKQDIEVIFVDLWSDRNQDPAKLIADAIRKSFHANKNLFEQIKGVVQKVKIAGYSVDLDSIGIGNDVTLSDALDLLSSKTNKMIVMIVDEAQHAMTSAKGIDALFALKAARDLLNASQRKGFRLVATGSNRDKLSILVNGKDQAFFNATLIDLPYLGDDYLAWELDQLGDTLKPTIRVMKQAFELSSYKPEPIKSALNEVVLDFSANENTMDQIFFEHVKKRLDEMNLQTIKLLNALRPLELSILYIMAKFGDDFAPFKSDFVARYKSFCLNYSDEASLEINTSSVQYSLDQLREKGFVWRSARGVYSFEEDSTREIVLSVVRDES